MEKPRSRNIIDATYAVADALTEVKEAVEGVKHELVRLGTNNCDTNMGGLELVAFQIKKLQEKIYMMKYRDE